MSAKSIQIQSSYRRQKHDAMRQSILEAARLIMREEGVAALTIHELARRMNLRASSLYNYFSGKKDIYDALFQLGFTLYGEYMEHIFQGTNTWQEYVRRSLEGYLSFAKENPELYQLCFERPVPGFVPSAQSMQISYALLAKAYLLAEVLFKEANTGLPIRQAVDLIIAMMHGITAMHLSNEPELPAGQGRFGSLIPAVITLLEKAW